MFSILLLGAIWGSSFLFMRLLVPDIGSYLTVFLRLALGALFLYAILRYRAQRLNWRANWRHYSVVGIVGVAIPFTGFGLAAHVLPAGYMSILNATTPYWATLLGVVALGERFTWAKLAGLIVGLTGVVILVDTKHIVLDLVHIGSILIGLCAGLCYSVSATYIRHFARTVPALSISTGSLIVSAVCLLPSLPFVDWPTVVWTPINLLAVSALGVLCSGLAFLIYMPMIERLGVIGSSLVTFVIPLFAFLWGYLLLGEAFGIRTAMGAGLVLLGLAMVLYLGNLKPTAAAAGTKPPI